MVTGSSAWVISSRGQGKHVVTAVLRPPSSLPRSSRIREGLPSTVENLTRATREREQEATDKWVYPSEQQYYNAIRRKGHKAEAVDMPTTLAIHNAVNEKGWAMVAEWERLHAGTDDVAPPKLLRFEGRPRDMSPKAWVKTYLLGYQAPFDRWVVDVPVSNGCGGGRGAVDDDGGGGGDSQVP